MAEEGQVIACHTVDAWKEQFEKGKESKKLIVVDFTAAWCPPCKMIAPIFAELAKKFPNVIFLKVDVDELKSVSEEWKVEAMPTFIFLKDGKEVDKIVGADKDGLPRMIAKHAGTAAAGSVGDA
ncbi:unnamed protein product [Dovyalis caffra]|uniref:Thioredoxin domain-containing protein n=1 Tax=Dovyalis caffra TaxID=77055 RepID=A0AAV1S7E1_9ROSI|nr:unnamed protein product [Dovyalis caffra]